MAACERCCAAHLGIRMRQTTAGPVGRVDMGPSAPGCGRIVARLSDTTATSGRKLCKFDTIMGHSNRPAGAVARSDRPRRSGGPTDHPGPSSGDSKGVSARSQTHA